MKFLFNVARALYSSVLIIFGETWERATEGINIPHDLLGQCACLMSQGVLYCRMHARPPGGIYSHGRLHSLLAQSTGQPQACHGLHTFVTTLCFSSFGQCRETYRCSPPIGNPIAFENCVTPRLPFFKTTVHSL